MSMGLNEKSNDNTKQPVEPLDVAGLLTLVREGQRYGLAACEQLDEVLAAWKEAGCPAETIFGIHRLILAHLETAWGLESLNKIGESLNKLGETLNDG